MKEMVASRTSRISSAALMPMRLAGTCCAAGSLLVRIEMKMRLSMPSTISRITSVNSATQAVGSETHTKCGARNSTICIGAS